MIRELFLRDLSLCDCLWQSVVFLAVGLAGGWLSRRHPSRAYALLLLAMMAAALVPFLSAVVRHSHLGVLTVQPPRPAQVVPNAPEPLPLGVPGTPPTIQISPPTVGTRPGQAPPTRTGIQWRAILLSGWLAATLLLLIRLIAMFVYGARLVRQAQRTGCGGIQETATRTASRLGFATGLQVRASDSIHSPVVWCWTRRPILLVPRAPGGANVKWMGVVAHELAHCKRGDHITGLMAELMASLLPWNPLMWVAKRFLIRLGEQACDDWVVASGQSSEDYAESLLRFHPQKQMAFWPTVVSSRSGLAYRIRRILNDACGNPRAGLKWAVLLSIAATGIGLSVAFAQTRPAPSDAPAHLGDLIRSFQDPNVNGGSYFGQSIAVVGSNVLVGAPMNKVAYLFEGSTGKLLRTFVAPPETKPFGFGWCVAALGRNVLIADFGDRTDGQGSGRAYLFNASTGALLRTFANPQPDNYVGFGVAIGGMGDDRVIIEAIRKSPSADSASGGSAFLFDASTGKMLQVFQKPKATELTEAAMGAAWVTGIDQQVLVGAPEDDTGAEQAGAVYVFDGATGKLARTFLNPTPTPVAFFGNCIAAAGDRVLIGATLATIDGKRAGAAYLFDRGTGRLLQSFMNPAPSEAGKYSGRDDGDYFGRCVAFVGNDILIGATWDDTGARKAGAAYLFEGTTGKVLHKFANPNPAVEAGFGVQAAALGNDILIAACDYKHKPNGKNRGVVYLFKGVD